MLPHIGVHFVIKFVFLHLIDCLMVFAGNPEILRAVGRDYRILCLKVDGKDLIFVLRAIKFILLCLSSRNLVLPNYYLLLTFVLFTQAYQANLFVALSSVLTVFLELLWIQLYLSPLLLYFREVERMISSDLI